MYTVTRQRQWPEGANVVEVYEGGIDYCNPDALSAKYSGEFEEYKDPREAVEVAIQIVKYWRKDLKEPIHIGVGRTGGYTMPFDFATFKSARQWAKEAYFRLEKCPHCGDVLPDEKRDRWHADDWSGLEYCSENCATREMEFQQEQEHEETDTEEN